MMQKAPRRTCFFLGDLGGGGAERSMLNLAVAFRKRGYEVDMFLLRAKGPYRDKVPQGIRLIEVGVHRFKLTLVHSIVKLARYMSLNRPDAVISALTSANLQVILAKLLTRAETRCIISVRSRPDQKPRSVGSRIRLQMLALLSHRADRIVAISDGVAGYLRATWPCPRDKVVRIYNPVYDEEVVAKSLMRADEDFLDNKTIPVVVAVGRLHRVKNHAMLLNAIKLVHRSRPVRLIVLGEGDMRRELQTLTESLGLAPYVKFLGFKENPYAYLSRADVFAHSSNFEAFANVLVEALTCGCPVVSTDCPSGPSEILENGKWGKLVPVGDARAMADAILETLDNPPPREALVERAKCFSVERAADEYERVVHRQPQWNIQSWGQRRRGLCQGTTGQPRDDDLQPRPRRRGDDRCRAEAECYSTNRTADRQGLVYEPPVTGSGLISVVIPLYNKARYIKRALDSVLSQTHQDFEVIVVNDGSTDGSEKVVEQYGDARIRLVNQQNAGECAARNRGVAEARAELIAFLDADDEWLPSHLETVLRLRKNHPECGAYASAFTIVTPRGARAPSLAGIPASSFEGVLPNYFRTVIGDHAVCSSGVVIPRRTFDTCGLFPGGEHRRGDLDMWCRIALQYPIAFSTYVGAVYHQEAENRMTHGGPVLAEPKIVQTLEDTLARGRFPDGVTRADLLEYKNIQLITRAQSMIRHGYRRETRRLLQKASTTRVHRGVLRRLTFLSYLPGSILKFALGVWVRWRQR
jgi:glycosyltransferase involved in cell wall biosynthesis